MKKIILPVLLSLVLSNAIAQVDLGIQIAPSISANRVSNDIADFKLENNGTQLSFTGGLIMDYYMTEHIALSTGIWYANKKATLKVGESQVDYSLQYLQVPISVKMFTNNITDKMRLYFQGGVTGELKLTEKALNDQAKELKKNTKFAKLYDIGLLISAGVEYNIGTSNKLYGGITYNRGLVNVYTEEMRTVIKDQAKATTDTPDEDIDSSKMSFNNNILSLVIGFKF